MTAVVVVFIILIAALHLCLHVGLTRGARGKGVPGKCEKSNEESSREEIYRPRISVVIAARNEEENLCSCLEHLIDQDYPESLVEIIVVDDRSTDRTREIIRSYSGTCPRIRGVRIDRTEAGISPKKFALSRGIELAEGDWIATTDADCAPPRGWLSGMVRNIAPLTGFVAGFSPSTPPEDGKDFLASFAFLDMAGVGAVESGFMELGVPLSCTGRNLLYSRKAFESVGGFREISDFVSGDDDLLMHLIHRTGMKCRFSWDPETVVPTNPPASWPEFLNARLRHASKSFSYPPMVRLILSWIYIVHLLPVLMLAGGIFSLSLLKAAGLVLVMKISCDALVLKRFSRRMGMSVKWLPFPIADFLHLFYVTVVPLMGNFGIFKWKGASYSRNIAKDEEPAIPKAPSGEGHRIRL